MQKSGSRPSKRVEHARPRRFPLTAAICLAFASPAFAQDAATQAPAPQTPAQREAVVLDTVTVTSQKRTENLQKVPISIEVLGEQKLDELNVTDFEDYVKYLPSVSYQSFGPGFAQIYMRGVASGGDGNHSGSLPSVGVYLDEQPVTTIQGPLDIHIYDVARVESLSGPQGTLYGASAQAGALRIITNKPDPGQFSAGYDLEVNAVDHGGIGHIEEGFVNIPLTDNSAIRLVGWNQHDAGYIDNKPGDRQFPQRVASDGGTPDDDSDDVAPSWGGVLTNRDCTSTDLLVCTGRAEDDYNEVDTTGARLAAKIDFAETWSITPVIMGQTAKAKGNFAFDEQVGDLALNHFYKEESDDKWWQGALTVEGKIGNFDLTYNYAHLKRNVDVDSDYNDYGFWYDTLASYNAYDDNDNLINPSQYIQGEDRYKKDTHELRIASPNENRLRFVGGLYWEDHKHDIQQRYKIDGFGDQYTITGWPDTIWLTKQEREDQGEAVFGELSFDFIPNVLTGTIGGRHFRSENSLKGFFGFSAGWAPGSSYGEQVCIDQFGDDPANWPSFNGAPCEVFDKTVKESGNLGKANLTWQITPDKMVYATWSEGYRPGGINRRGTLPPYLSDYLTNYEMGWKTSWADHRLVFNGSVFHQEWEDFQFSILGANGLTEIKNANQASIDGLEMDLNWAATYNLTLGGGVAFYDAKLTENYCGFTDDAGNPVTDCDAPEAPDGTRLPVTPEFKGNLIARYNFNVGEYDAFVQGAFVYVGERESDLRILERGILGDLPSYNVTDLSAGFSRNNWAVSLYLNNVFDERAEIYRFTNCAETVCGASGVVPEYPNGQVYTITNQPRTFGVRFSQKF
ncbi:TonB-dependent receptor [Lysobacter niastensis]|uniref:TonB-dependent receptor n=1 Tax=Lysobacter niastensis TaxID=380629 RepID=A0ABS0B5F3_9GAMM|nr:TonB-dependent receptor [Lysobacter niastensis]MBF6024071.1 TonB-dependent receptor [Lysobacter niastensis]